MPPDQPTDEGQTDVSVGHVEDWTHMLSFERSTRLRDNVGSQNGTVSDPAEGTRDHTDIVRAF